MSGRDISLVCNNVENRRIKEEDMMQNDYDPHDARYYCQKSTYYSSESVCMSYRRRKK